MLDFIVLLNSNHAHKRKWRRDETVLKTGEEHSTTLGSKESASGRFIALVASDELPNLGN